MGTDDLDAAVLEWLPQSIENVAIELGKLIEEEGSVVGLRDQARTQVRAATDHGGI